MAPQLKVHTSKGDAAVHLLCYNVQGGKPVVRKAVLIDGGFAKIDEESNQFPQNQKIPKREKSNFLRTIDYINREYDFEKGQNFDDKTAPTADLQKSQLRFDSVVITHWDNDHWRGVYGLIEEGCIAYLKGNAQNPTAEFCKLFMTAYNQKNGTNKTLDRSGYDQVLNEVQTSNSKEKTRDIYRLLASIWGREDHVVRCQYFKYADAPNAIGTDVKLDTKLFEGTPDADYLKKVKDGLLTSVFCPHPTRNKVPATSRVGPRRKNTKPGDDDNGLGGTDSDATIMLSCRFANQHVPSRPNKANENHLNIMTGEKSNLRLDSTFNPWKNTPHAKGAAILEKQYVNFGPLARLYGLYDDYLGAELFYGSFVPSDNTWTDVLSPAHLLKAYKLTSADGPRMYIIAGDQKLLGDAPLGENNDMINVVSTAPAVAMKHRGAAFIVDTKDKVLGKGSRVEDKYRTDEVRAGKNWSHLKNGSSIVCTTLVSKEPTAIAETSEPSIDSLEILHYNGGDVLWDVEGGLARWFSGGWPRADKGGWKAAAGKGWQMGSWRTSARYHKLSHHGSNETNQVNLVDVLSPYLIVAPCGHEYFHPQPETLIMLHAQILWYEKLLTASAASTKPTLTHSKRGPNLLCCSYPATLLATNPSFKGPTGNFAFKRLWNDTANVQGKGWTSLTDDQRFRRVVGTYYGRKSDQTPADHDILQNWNKNLTKKSDTDQGKRNKICSLLQSQWKHISAYTGDYPILGIMVEQDPANATLNYSIIQDDGKTTNQTQEFLVQVSPMDVVATTDQAADTAVDMELVVAQDASNDGSTAPSKKRKAIEPSQLTKILNADEDSSQRDYENNYNLKKVKKTSGAPPQALLVHHAIADAISHEMSDLSLAPAQPTLPPRAALVRGPNIMLYGTRFPYSNVSTFKAWLRPDDQDKYGLCGFLDRTSAGFLELNSTLSPSSSLASTDPLFQAISASRSGVNKISFIGTMPDDHNQYARITGINARLQKGVVELNFSSARTSYAMQSFDTLELAGAFAPGFGVLALGLEPVEREFSLIEVLTIFGPDWASGLASITSLPGLDSSLNPKFKLDESEGSRNALMLTPFRAFDHHVRLRFLPSDPSFSSNISQKLPFQNTLSLANVALTLSTCHTSSAHTSNEGRSSIVSNASTRMIVEATIKITPSNGSEVDVNAWLDYSALQTRLILRFDSTGTTSVDPRTKWNGILKWLSDQLPIGAEPLPSDMTSFFPFLGGSESLSIDLKQAEITLRNPAANQKFGLDHVTIRLEIKFFESLFEASLTFPNPRLKLKLWNRIPPTLADHKLQFLPSWERFDDIHPSSVSDVTGTFPIGKIAGTSTTPPPQGIHADLDDFELTVEKSNGQPLQVFITASVGASLSTSSLPMPILGYLQLSGTWEAAATAADSASWTFLISTEVIIFPRSFDDTVESGLSPAVLDFSAAVENDGWSIEASARELAFGTIYDFFDSDAQEGIMDMLEHLSLARIDFSYSHPKGGPSQLSASGSLELGPIELDIAYMYSDKSNWMFRAHLGFLEESSPEIKLVDLLDSFFPPDDTPDLVEMLEEVPFLNDLAVPSMHPGSATSQFADAPIQLHVSTTEDGNALVMWLQITVITDAGTLHCTFVQHTPARKKPASGDEHPPSFVTPPVPKRLIRLRLDNLPKIPSVPVIGQIDQPLDALEYVLVVDQAGRLNNNQPNSTVRPLGLTLDELGHINSAISAENPANIVQFKQVQSPNQDPDNKTDAHYVLVAGHHFIAISGGKVILDHCFGSSQPPSKQRLVAANSGSLTAKSATTQDSGATMGQYQKSNDLITIKNVGIQCKNDNVYIMLDATVMLGPIELGITGFGAGIPLKKATNLKALVPSDFDVVFRGMGVSFIRPPIAIAGYFEHNAVKLYEEYLGGLMVSIPPYTLLAVGAYRHTFDPDFSSVFVFASLDGPLVSLEFAEISGVSAGFGYQYDLRLPDVASVQNFPFVHGQLPQPSPMELMSSSSTDPSAFHKWITAKPNTLFFAVGMKIDSFQVISADVALMVAFDGPNPKFALVGIASASMPPTKTRGQRGFLFAEFGITAALDINGGSFIAGAQLTNNSYILAPEVHLIGGFALSYWFGSNAHAGDWVFTIGGFHPAFDKPAHYPAPPRVGISWNLSDVLTVRGESFFAVCPKAAMGGGRLLAVFNAGPIYASFEAFASFLVNFKPFFFVADIGVRIVVGVHIDIGIIHIHIDCDLSASLHLQGPPFGGVAHVHFWWSGFDVYFGSQDGAPGALPWDDFLKLVRKPGPTSGGSSDASSDLVVVAIEDGAATDRMKGQSVRKTGDIWTVRAGKLRFRIDCKFPLDVMEHGDGTNTWLADRVSSNKTTSIDLARAIKTSTTSELIYARPMHETQPLLSILNVTITRPYPVDSTATPFKVQPILKLLPDAIWAQYKTSEDPLQSGNNIGKLLSSEHGTHEHLTGFIFTKPVSSFPPDNIPPFNAMDSIAEAVFDHWPKSATREARDERPVLLSSAPVQQSELPALRVGSKPGQPDDWDVMETAWKGVDAENLAEVLEEFAAATLWSHEDKALINAQPPPQLINAFEDHFLACPWVEIAIT